jgi:hypothetical protein
MFISTRGGMSASWMYTGMAIRLAQDLGLYRDVDKWPVQRFSHEEKQTRKRVWWGAIILDVCSVPQIVFVNKRTRLM